MVRYIDEEDLFRFMSKEEVENVLPLFEGAVETGKIKRKTLKNWLVNLYHISFVSCFSIIVVLYLELHLPLCIQEQFYENLLQTWSLEI